MPRPCKAVFVAAHGVARVAEVAGGSCEIRLSSTLETRCVQLPCALPCIFWEIKKKNGAIFVAFFSRVQVLVYMPHVLHCMCWGGKSKKTKMKVAVVTGSFRMQPRYSRRKLWCSRASKYFFVYSPDDDVQERLTKYVYTCIDMYLYCYMHTNITCVIPCLAVQAPWRAEHYIYIYIYIDTYMYIYIYIHTYIHVYIYTCIQTYIYITPCRAAQAT